MDPAPHVLLVVSDTICPWCWIGKRRLDAALAVLAGEGLRFERRWHPFLLNPDMPRGGVPRGEYRARKFGSLARAAELDARVAAEGAGEGLAFRFDRIARTPDTRDSHRLIRWAASRGGPAAADAMGEAVMSAYFSAGEDIGDAGILARLAAGAGQDPAEAAAMLAGEEGRAAVEEDVARAAGIGGVPAVILGGRLVLHGAQRSHEAVAALRAAVAMAPAAD